MLTSQVLVYASLAMLNAIETRRLLEKAYTLDFSQDNDNVHQDALKTSENFWGTHLLTE